MSGHHLKYRRAKRILLSFVAALIGSLGVWPVNSIAGETSANQPSFEVPVSNLKAEAKPIYYLGKPLAESDPTLDDPRKQQTIESARKFPDTLSCLMYGTDSETVSLVNLNVEKFEKISDLEICMQRVINELGDISRIEPWLHAVGFEGVGEHPNYWLGPGNEDVGPILVGTLWRLQDSVSGKPLPMSSNYNQTEGRAIANLAISLAVNRRDVRVISIETLIIICDIKREKECQSYSR